MQSRPGSDPILGDHDHFSGLVDKRHHFMPVIVFMFVTLCYVCTTRIVLAVGIRHLQTVSITLAEAFTPSP